MITISFIINVLFVIFFAVIATAQIYLLIVTLENNKKNKPL